MRLQFPQRNEKIAQEHRRSPCTKGCAKGILSRCLNARGSTKGSLSRRCVLAAPEEESKSIKPNSQAIYTGAARTQRLLRLPSRAKEKQISTRTKQNLLHFSFSRISYLVSFSQEQKTHLYYEPQILNVILRIEPSTTRVGGSIIDVGCGFQRGSEHHYVNFRYYLTSTFLLLPSAIFTMFRPLTGASSLRPSIE